jgi:glycosyltransferase involved in cell wall biosynthesis
MMRPIVYDLTRLFLGPLFRTPRGIDRVEFLLARHLVGERAADFHGLLPTPWGMRLYDAARVSRGLTRLESLWAENGEVAADASWENFVARMTNKPAVAPTRPSMGAGQQIFRMLDLLTATGVAPGRSAIRDAPPGAVYLNVGHYSLGFPFLLRWLRRRPDVKPIFMLHDVIPLETPEYVSEKGAALHAAMVTSAARLAKGVIVSTEHARETISAALQRAGGVNIPSFGWPLPLAESFDEPADPDPRLAHMRYFVVCGAIEPRKNHLFLLDLWRHLCAELRNPPHLLVIGSPAWHGDHILDEIQRCELTKGRIHILSGLSTVSLKIALAGSLGLLSPSLAEGFGLPVIEAAHLGVPVIASDIAAHREVAREGAILCDAMDAPSWLREIRTLMETSPRRAPLGVARAREERRAYFAAISSFLDDIRTN